MRFKRLLALLAAAALALTLLAACGGGISSRLLLDALKGQVENVSVETSAEFDRAVKTAVEKAGSSDAEAILAALQQELRVNPVRFTSSILGSSPVGSQSLNVRVEVVNNAAAAANNAASAWLGVLRYLPDDGSYTARVSIVEVNGGYVLAIQVTVEQPGSTSDDDKPSIQPGEPGYKDDNYAVSQDGTTYTVFTSEGLSAWAENIAKSPNCILEADKTVALPTDWPVITNYSGTFDGNGSTITGVSTVSGNYQGLFATVAGGTVQNVKLAEVDINGGTYSGAVVGYNKGGTIRNCEFVSGTVQNGSTCTGGIVGRNYGSVIGCTVSGSVVGDSPYGVGGIAGYTESSSSGTVSLIQDCTVNADVSGKSVVGGIIGVSTGDSTVINCTINGDVSGTSSVGGVVGQCRGNIENCTVSGVQINGTSSMIGGIAGRFLSGTISNCSSAASVNGTSFVGGIVGSSEGNIQNSHSTGTVSGSGDGVGGIVGECIGSIRECYSEGTVTGRIYVGGIAGSVNSNNGNPQGDVVYCYSTANVNGSNTIGGIAGSNDGRISSCYYAGGHVAGYPDIGGIAGTTNMSYSQGVIKSFWSGVVDGDKGVGGTENPFIPSDATKVDGTNVTWSDAAKAMGGPWMDQGPDVPPSLN